MHDVFYLFWVLNPERLLGSHEHTEGVQEEGVLFACEVAGWRPPRVQLTILEPWIVGQFIALGDHCTLQFDTSQLEHDVLHDQRPSVVELNAFELLLRDGRAEPLLCLDYLFVHFVAQILRCRVHMVQCAPVKFQTATVVVLLLLFLGYGYSLGSLSCVVTRCLRKVARVPRLLRLLRLVSAQVRYPGRLILVVGRRHANLSLAHVVVSLASRWPQLLYNFDIVWVEEFEEYVFLAFVQVVDGLIPLQLSNHVLVTIMEVLLTRRRLH